VDAAFLKSVPSLYGYNPKAKWLVRQEVKFVPANSNEDLMLTLAETENFATVAAGKQVRFNPSLLNSNNGILPGERGHVVGTDGQGNAYAFGRSLTVGSVGADVKELQKILNAEGFLIADSGPGSLGNESTYFGVKTKLALIKYQNFYRADIGITAGTGYFGPATIKFINK
jgi:peptidoglycan hydrolase-like protein with peptidoglycan-binding domain